MVLALAGSYHDYHDHGDYHHLDNHNPKCVFVIVEQVIITTMIKVLITMTISMIINWTTRNVPLLWYLHY